MGKKHGPEEIIGKLREAEIVLAQGGTASDACRLPVPLRSTYSRQWQRTASCTNIPPGPLNGGRSLLPRDCRQEEDIFPLLASKLALLRQRRLCIGVYRYFFNFCKAQKTP